MTQVQRVNPIGISPHLEYLSTADIDKQLNLMRESGIQWVRQEFHWAAVEPAPGKWEFTKYDYIVNGILSRGMGVIGLLSQYWSPIWYRGAAPWNQPPLPKDYALFAGVVVLHYKGKVPLYEVGNEPNQGLFWYPSPNVPAYTALLKAGYTAIKTSDSSVKVISAGLSPMSPEVYLSAMYASGAQGYMDYIGYHPYSHPNGPDYSAGTPSFAELANIKSIMASNGDSNKQIMVTEVGWPTYPGGVDVSAQAAYIQRVFQKVMHENYQYVAIACVYDFVDDGTDATNAENNFGLLHADYTQKPAYTALQLARDDYNANFTPINP